MCDDLHDPADDTRRLRALFVADYTQEYLNTLGVDVLEHMFAAYCRGSQAPRVTSTPAAADSNTQVLVSLLDLTLSISDDTAAQVVAGEALDAYRKASPASDVSSAPLVAHNSQSLAALSPAFAVLASRAGNHEVDDSPQKHGEGAEAGCHTHRGVDAAHTLATLEADYDMLRGALSEIFHRRPCDYKLDMALVREADQRALMRVMHLLGSADQCHSPVKIAGVWRWDTGGLRDDPQWRLTGLKSPREDGPKNDVPLFATAHAAAQEGALERFNRCMTGQADVGPLERLRFFCSLAMPNGTDWLDVEPFFDALEVQKSPVTREQADCGLVDHD